MKKRWNKAVIYGTAGVLIIAVMVILTVLVGNKLFGGKKPQQAERAEQRTTKTSESARYQKEMEALAEAKEIEITEDEYGTIELTAQVTLPDYSLYFEQYLEEAVSSSNSEADFEKRLFELTAKHVKGEENSTQGIRYTTQTVHINLSLADSSRKKEDWKEEALKKLAAQTAFEKEMEDFALSLLRDVEGQITDWEME